MKQAEDSAPEEQPSLENRILGCMKEQRPGRATELLAAKAITGTCLPRS